MAASTEWVNEKDAAKGSDIAAVAVGHEICDKDQDTNACPSACENQKKIHRLTFSCTPVQHGYKPASLIAIEALVEEIGRCSPPFIPISFDSRNFQFYTQ